MERTVNPPSTIRTFTTLQPSSRRQSNNPLVINAKLDRPLDSHAPQTAANYAYEADDWGEHDESYEQELYSQEYEHDLWDTEYENQDEEYHEEYTAEQEEAEHEDEQGASHDSEDQDEDDQGNYD